MRANYMSTEAIFLDVGPQEVNWLGKILDFTRMGPSREMGPKRVIGLVNVQGLEEKRDFNKWQCLLQLKVPKKRMSPTKTNKKVPVGNLSNQKTTM